MYWGDLPRVSGAGFILSANATHAIKLLTLIVNRDLFVSLIDFIWDSLKKRDLKDPDTHHIIISFERTAFRDIIVILCGASLAVFGLVGVGDLMDHSGLPLVAWYPFDISPPAVYISVYVHQMVAVFIAASLNVTLDMFTNSVVIQLCCQFELLKRDIGQIRRIPADQEAKITALFHELIERQVVLKMRCTQLSQAYGTSMLAQFMGSIFIICISFYQFYRASDTSFLTLVAILCTLTGAFLQVFFYCYYGNEIMIKVRVLRINLIVNGCLIVSVLDYFIFSESICGLVVDGITMV